MSLKVTKISKNDGQKWILRDVSFEANAGEIFGVFGSSLSGTSTVIDSLTGNDKTITGEITFNDKELKIGDSRNFYFSNTSNESLWGKLVKSNRNHQSSNEQQIACIENALNSNADVLLLDDCFSQLDEITKLGYIEKLRRFVRENQVIIIFAGHRFDDILLLCDRVAVIDGGEVHQIAVPHVVYDQPETAAVGRLSGRNNLFEARRLTSSKSDSPRYQSIQGEHKLNVQKFERSGLAPLNQNLILGIRPEHISISFGASFPEDNLLKATVTDIRYLGATTLVELDSNGLKLSSIVLRLVGLNIGDECLLGLPPDRIRVYKR